jgi:hypothetical protein
VRGPVVARAGALYWYAGQRLYSVPWPPSGEALRSRTVARVRTGAIVDLAIVPAGVAALVSRRVHGQGWDWAPRLVFVRSGLVRTVTLPRVGGGVLARSLRVDWPTLGVHAVDFVSFDRPEPVIWTSEDGGVSWVVTRGPGA